MNIWTILWLGWGLAFALIEGAAIANDRAEGYGLRTLSVHLRRWFHTDTHRGRTAWLVTSGVFFAWFVTHIAVAGAA